MSEHDPGPWKAKQTAGGEWWIMAPDDSDHDFRDDYEPIFESSGTGLNFEADAHLIAVAPEMYDYIKIRADRGEETARRLIAKASATRRE